MNELCIYLHNTIRRHLVQFKIRRKETEHSKYPVNVISRMCQCPMCPTYFGDVKQSKQIESTWHVRPNILCKQLKGFRHSNCRCLDDFRLPKQTCVFRPQNRSWNADCWCRSRGNDFHLILNYLLVFHHIPSAPFVTDDRWSVFALWYLFCLAFESFTFIFTTK